MRGEGGFDSPVLGSGEGKENNTMEEKLKILGVRGSQTRKKRVGKRNSKPLAARKRFGETDAANSPGILERKGSGTVEVEGGGVNEGKLRVSEKGKYLQNVVYPKDWSAGGRELRPRKKQQQQQSSRKGEEYSLGDVMISKADARRIIGRRIQVFWPLDDDWYFGTVECFDGGRKRHHVIYDDGDDEWLELARERFKIQLYPEDSFRKTRTTVEADKMGGQRSDRTNQSRRKSKDGRRRRGRRIGKVCNTAKEKPLAVNRMDLEEVANMFGLKKTAPRSKRTRIAKQYNQKHTAEHVNFRVASTEDTDMLDIKEQNVQNDGKEETGIGSDFCRIDDMDGSRQGKQQNVNLIDESPVKETHAGDGDWTEEKYCILPEADLVEHAKEKDNVSFEEVDEAKSANKTKPIKELDEKELTAVPTNHNQLDTNQTAEWHFSNQDSQLLEDKMTLDHRPNITHQLEEEQSNVGGIDEKVNEKQGIMDLVSIHGSKSKGSKEKEDEKQSDESAGDGKVAVKLANWDLASALGDMHGIRKQRSLMKIRLRDSITGKGSLSPLNKEGQTVDRQSLQSSPGWEGFSVHMQSNLG